MATTGLWVVFLIAAMFVTGTTKQSCNGSNPVATMCQIQAVRGPVVSLDVTAAAAGGYSSCSCLALMTSGTTALVVRLDTAPTSPQCGTQLNVYFMDRNISYSCGSLQSQETSSGRTAGILYNMNGTVSQPDSSYCLTFSANLNDTAADVVISCNMTDVPTLTPGPVITSTAPQTNSTQDLITKTQSEVTSASEPTVTTPPTAPQSSPISGNSTAEAVGSTTNAPHVTAASDKAMDHTTAGAGHSGTSNVTSNDTNTAKPPTTTHSSQTTHNSTAPTSNTNATTAIFNSSTTVVSSDNVTQSIETTTQSSNISTSPSTADTNITMTTGVDNVTMATTTQSANITNTTGTADANITMPTGVDNVTMETTTQSDIISNTTGTVDTNITMTTGIDNATIATTRRQWIPPTQKNESSSSPSIAVIVVPILAILLVGFVSICVWIMCKRARKAARQTEVPEEEKKKADPGDMYRKGTGFITANYYSDGSKNKELNKPQTELNGNKPGNNNNKEEKSDSEKEKYSASPEKSGVEKNKTADDEFSPSIWEADNNNLELATIVIESDPEDENRYFKKADPGDWYRIIMKGKVSKDSDVLQQTSGQSKPTKTTGHGDKKDNPGSDKKKRKEHRYSSEEIGSSSDSSRRRNRKGGSKSKSSSSIAHKTSGANDGLSSVKYKSACNNPDGRSIPLDETKNEPKKDKSPEASVHTIAQPNIIMSVPKPATDTNASKTRLIMSKPSSVTMPASTAQIKVPVTKQPSPTTGKPQVSNSQQGAVKVAGISPGPNIGDSRKQIRPDIVPPLNLLNLSGTGSIGSRSDLSIA